MSRSRPLRVALDITQVDNQGPGSGQFRYAADLVRGLCASDAIALTLFGSTPRPVAEFAAPVEGSRRHRYVELPPLRGRGYYYRDSARLAWRLARHRVDVFHQLHTNIPAIKPCPLVATVYHYHDDPALFASRPYRYYLRALRCRTDLVIAISEATRDDWHRHFGIPLDRIRTVYLGLSTSFETTQPARPGAYLLSPYNLSTPKNLRSLILAWPAIAERHPASDLILYGRAHVTPQAEAEMSALIAGLPHGDRIRRIGRVTDAELAALYRDCALFVFPTTVEGFGYPLLEAMAHGACCVTRGASAMKEVGADAVVLVETLHPEEIAAAAGELLADPARRATLGRLARQRAERFTVEAMVGKTIDCYASVARRAAGAGPHPSRDQA